MRWICGVALAALAPARAWADGTASAGVGAGALGDRAMAALDLGVDASGERWALGLGTRLRFVDGDLVDSDWDESSDVARVLRYATALRPIGPVDLAVAAGELGGVRLGRGLIVAGYGAGVDADHGHLGAVIRGIGQEHELELMFDDVVAPRFAVARLERADRDRTYGVTAATDWQLPASGMGPDGEREIGILGIDAQIGGSRNGARGGGFVELAMQFGAAVGVGLCAGILGELENDRVRATARLGFSLGSDHFVPGWFGPLYEVERRGLPGAATPEVPMAADAMDATLPLIDRAAAGGLAGPAPLLGFDLTIADLGELAVTHLGRPGLPDVSSLRLAAPYFRDAQAAVSGAVAWGNGRTESAALAGELRVRLPSRMYAAFEVARLYRDGERGLYPVWTGLLSLGAVVGEPAAPDATH